MGRVGDSISTFNTTVRTILATAVVGGLSYGAFLGYQKYNEAEIRERALHVAQEELKVLRAENKAKQEQIERLETAMRLLKVDHRLAKITVLKVGQYADGKHHSEVEFVEIDGRGEPVGEPRVFFLRGDKIYVDGLVVKFKDEYIEQGDLLRGSSLFSFNSIYGNDDGPNGGHRLDDVGARPMIYARGGTMSDFEKKIWDDFWGIASSASQQSKMGIRQMYGQANYIKAVQGTTYFVKLRASDGGGLDLLDDAPAPLKGKDVL